MKRRPILLFHAQKGLFAALQEALIKIHLAPGHLLLEVYPQAFQRGKTRSLAVGARGVVVFYAHEKGVVRRFKFRKPPKGFDLSRKAIGIVEPWALIAEVGYVPTQGIAGEPRNFVIEVMPSGQNLEAAFAGGLVEKITLDLAAGRADRAAQKSFDIGYGQALLGHIPNNEREAVLRAEALHHAARRRRRLSYAQINVQAGDVITLSSKFQHEGEGVLAAGECHKDAVFLGHELLFAYASIHLTGKEIQKASRAEGGIMAGQGYNGFSFAAATLHKTSQMATAAEKMKENRCSSLHRALGIR